MRLTETFQDPSSRVYRVIMFIDMSGSTAMKAREPESTWLTTYGWFYDVISSNVLGEDGGKIVKYLGDGAMVVYGENHASEAVNAAIKIQEQVADDVQDRRVNCLCTIGIATGEVVQFDPDYGVAESHDYIGSVVDRASRLCSSASPQAIFVDRQTIGAAQIHKLHSRLGDASVPRRGGDEYLGKLQELSAKGFSHTIEYHEIFWSQQAYGVKSDTITEIVRSPPVERPVVAQTAPQSSGGRASRASGPGSQKRVQLNVIVEGRPMFVTGSDFKTMLAVVKAIDGSRYVPNAKIWRLPDDQQATQNELGQKGLRLESHINVVVNGQPMIVGGGSFQDLLAAVKNIPGRKFDPAKKTWVISGDVNQVSKSLESNGFWLESNPEP